MATVVVRVGPNGEEYTKTRSQKIDPLRSVIKNVSSGDLENLKEISDNSEQLLTLFKERLAASRVPKERSPLIAAILNDHFEVFSYLLNNFPCNVEQETSAVIGGGYPVDGASPLWTASTLGRLEFVKLLVSKGADIEHTTDSKSSPLRGAAFDGHCNVCEFLIGQGADIDKPNQVGQSPLTIAAAMQKKECVELLIKKGADVNHKGHNGDTPLHVSVESGVVEIAKLLVDAGAKNDPNDVGFTPAILACCYGHKDVMMYLEQTFTFSVNEKYDCFCLLAAKEVLASNVSKAEEYVTKAIEIRNLNPEKFSDMPAANPIYDNIQEPASLEDLQFIFSNETRMFFVSSIYCERILGQVHPTTAFYIRISGDMVLADDRYAKCIDLWHRSLEFDNAARMAYELQITEDLLFAVRGFSIMCNEGFIPPIQPHFRWGLKEFRMAHESKIPEVAVVSCLFRMLAVWIMVVDHIEEPVKVESEWELIRSAVDELIEAMCGRQTEVLVACLQNLPPEHSSGAGKDIVKMNIPLDRVIATLLDRGCPLHCEDEHGNFPLHLAVNLQDKNAVSCVRMLLDYGAHYDAVNYKGETALSLAKERSDMQHEMARASVSRLSLQCLASRVVVQHGLHHLGMLPPRCLEFVAWHEGDTKGESDHDENPFMVPCVKVSAPGQSNFVDIMPQLNGLNSNYKHGET